MRLHPFEVGSDYLASHIDEMVDVTFADIQSQFLMMPRGQNFIEFGSFQGAYEVLKQETDAFARFNDETVWKALERNALVFVVVRTILGVSPPEWAELAKAERDVSVPQNVARQMDARCRTEARYFARDLSALSRRRIEALVSVAVEHVTKGAPSDAVGTVHRLNKIDTLEGLAILHCNCTEHHVAGRGVRRDGWRTPMIRVNTLPDWDWHDWFEGPLTLTRNEGRGHRQPRRF